MGIRKKRILFMIAMLWLFFVEVTFAKEQVKEPTQLYAKAAVLMDADTGRVLFEVNGQEALPMASTTKIMTCILALEEGNLSDLVTFSTYAASMPDVQLNAKAGEVFTLRDLLFSLMLESHNDTAVAIAEHIAGSVEGFAAKMNQKAVEIGCENTFFVTPNGLDGEFEGRKHATSATDLARIMSYCITQSSAKDLFLEITSTPSYLFHNQILEENGNQRNGSRSFSCTNHNAFLQMMEGAISGKTGFTSAAGYCYVGALKREEKTFVVALLACGWPSHKTYKWSDTKKLMEYGLQAFSYQRFDDIPIEQIAYEAIPITNAQTEWMGEDAQVSVVVQEKQEMSKEEGVLLRQDEEVSLHMEKETRLKAPCKKGSVVGRIRYMVNDEVFRELEIITKEEIKGIDFRWCFDQVLKRFWMKDKNMIQ